MESFIVPVYNRIGKHSDEKLLIGLIMVGKNHIWFQYSQKKLKIIKKIINPLQYSLTKLILEQIQEKIKETNSNLSNGFENNNIFNLEYFDYLNRYAQNNIMFGEAQILLNEASSEVFKINFEKQLLENFSS